MSRKQSVAQKKRFENPKERAKISATLTGRKQSPEHTAKIKTAANSTEVLALIQQYGSPLINVLRSKYINLNLRCNNPNSGDYHNYGGRGIQNLFPSQLNFLLYIINVLGYNTFESIDGLEIDRIDNDGNYEPGNIRFITHQVSMKNRRRFHMS